MDTLNEGFSRGATNGLPAPSLVGDAPVRRVMIGVDRSQTSDRAARWAALFANLYGAELLVVQVIVPEDGSASTASAADHARADAARAELPSYARSLAGERGVGGWSSSIPTQRGRSSRRPNRRPSTCSS